MNIDKGYVTLGELAKELNIGSATIRQHLYHNRGGIAEGATKYMNRQTGDYLLNVNSVLNFIYWLRGHGRKITHENMDKVEAQLTAWQRENENA